jgi:hypothetical protein
MVVLPIKHQHVDRGEAGLAWAAFEKRAIRAP